MSKDKDWIVRLKKKHPIITHIGVYEGYPRCCEVSFVFGSHITIGRGPGISDLEKEVDEYCNQCEDAIRKVIK